MGKELRIKSRKIANQRLKIQEFKTFLLQLTEQYQLPDKVSKAIEDIQDKFGFNEKAEDLEDSVLYLSSNWSAGGLEPEALDQAKKESPRKSFKIDVQKAIDLPPETSSDEEEMSQHELAQQ